MIHDPENSIAGTERTGGRFTPGRSGNPSGRPKSESAILRQSLADGGAEVVAAILKAAKAGDVLACKFVLDRLVPPLKPTAQAVQVSLPEGADPLSIARAVLLSAAAGTLPPDIAAQLVTAAGTLARVEEVQELRDRIAALEKATTPPTTNKKSKP
jgi:hypothetical protein